MELIANELIPIADELPVCQVPDPDGGVSERIDPAGVQRNRLRVDTRKWLMSKLLPKKYGENQHWSGELSIKTVLLAPAQKPDEGPDQDPHQQNRREGEERTGQGQSADHQSDGHRQDSDDQAGHAQPDDGAEKLKGKESQAKDQAKHQSHDQHRQGQKPAHHREQGQESEHRIAS